jgi:hypothetical protein
MADWLDRIDDWLLMMSYRQYCTGVPVPPMKDTLIRESRLQNNPDGAFEPPRTGSPCTILPVATFTSLASADTQSFGFPAAQFLIKPLLPYTNTYGCSDTTPPDTDTLLLNVSVELPVVVALFDNVTLVYDPSVNTSPVVVVTTVVTADPPLVADNVNVVE